MTNYPITDPAEIAKLPDGIYLVRGPEHSEHTPTTVVKHLGQWFDGNGNAIPGVGGIAARLVPEDRLAGAIRLLREWNSVTHPGPSADLQRRTEAALRDEWDTAFPDKAAKAEAQRDRAVELLRDLAEVVDERVWTAFAIAGLVGEWAPKVRAFLAEQGDER